MPSRPMTRANIIDQVNNIMGTTLTTSWADTKVNQLLDDVLTEVSGSVPYICRDIYTIESRTGSATSTSAPNLVDSGNSQFLSTDTGKVVYNTTDKTWGVITSYSSASQVGLSKDIFTSGENYEIYNKGCWNNRQINIENSSDYLWVIGAVYPVLPEILTYPLNEMRNVIQHNRDIIELDVLNVDDSGVSDADKDVYIYFARQHKLNVMTDLGGAVNNGVGYVAGDVSMALDVLGSTELIAKDTLFTVALASGITSRLTYRITSDVTTSANTATISFWPGLESAVVDDAVVTFIGSTLLPELEPIVVQIVTGEALMAEAVVKTNATAFGGSVVSGRYYDIGERMAEKARRKLKALIDVDLRASYIFSRG